MSQVRPLPGIVFRAEPQPVVALPRMDVAAFVGFARRGPVNVPVAVEDYPRFEDIFGGVYPLAWDDETATVQTACLAPTVRSFFEQGGRRCWVVRVALLPDGTDDAQADQKAAINHIPLVGLLRTRDASHYHRVLTAARSAGSWSDTLQAGASILLDPIQSTADTVQPHQPLTLTAAHLRGQRLQAGDMLQIDFTDKRHRAYVVLHQNELTRNDDGLMINASSANVHWFQRVTASDTPTVNGTVSTVTDTPASVTGTLTVNGMALALSGELGVQAGDWLTIEVDSRTAWLLVKQVRGADIILQAAWWQGFDVASEDSTLTVARIQRVQMALQVREEPDRYRTLPDMAFSAPHPRFAGYLPDDATLYDPGFGLPQFDPDAPSVIAADLYAEASSPRFPVVIDLRYDPSESLATAQNDTVLIPLGLETAPIYRQVLPLSAEPLVRDGLVPVVADLQSITGADWAQFWQSVYLDPILKQWTQRSFKREADDRLYIQNKSLLGLHALYPVEEISSVALPDAVHRGWILTRRERATIADESDETEPETVVDTGIFKVCEPETTPEIEAPLEAPPTDVVPGWTLLPIQQYDAAGLLEIQRQAAILAAARGDCVALLSLAKHYRRGAAIQHQRDLYPLLRAEGDTTDSYVALYHPWLVKRNESDGTLLHVTPDGAVSGMMAKRTLERGAWVAPANVALRDTLALLPSFNTQDAASLYQAGLNPIQGRARGFVVGGASTQSLDVDLMNLNVRRLLILLRRIALREGERYVFAPHDARFRQRVKQDFEQRLALLFERGAFSGTSPSESYQVVIDETLNIRRSVEAGRLIVELRVAPSQPLTFITVRLLQTDNGLLTIEEVIVNA